MPHWTYFKNEQGTALEKKKKLLQLFTHLFICLFICVCRGQIAGISSLLSQ